MHDELHGLQQQVDAFLLAHDADIADQVLAAVFQRRIRRHLLHAREIRAGTHHEHIVRVHAAARQRDVAIRLVGGDHHVGGPESHALQRQQQFLAEAAPAELGFVELGIDVVVIEHELLAEQLVETADEENRVRRIAGVDDVEAAAEQDLQRQPELHDQRHAVLERITQRAVGLARQRMPVNVDAVDALEALLVARAPWGR